MKTRYQHHASEHMPWTNPRRKDHGSMHPVRRRASLLSAATGFLAIAFFVAGLLITFHFLPAAIDAEIAKQEAVAERSTGVRQ